MNEALVLLLKALQIARLGNELIVVYKPIVDELVKTGQLTPEEEQAYRDAYDKYREESPAIMQQPHWQVQPDPEPEGS